MEQKIGIGYQSYEEMMTKDIFYIDKTLFIRDWWENADKVTLITRPRRFGKTLNLSTIECFFSNRFAGRGDLFEGKAIWKAERNRQLQGKYPVIFMSFADVRTTDDPGLSQIEEMKRAVKQVIAGIYKKYKDIMKSELFDEDDREQFASVSKDMDDLTAVAAITTLCTYLEKYYGKKAIITGITRISKESILSDLNHLEVVTTTSDRYAPYFGFTEEEVFRALDDAGMSGHKQGVKRWYDGFTFGKYADIYNPWSIISFLKNAGMYETYWSNTSSNGLVSMLMKTGSAAMKQTVEDLIAGKSFCAPIDEQIVFDQIEKDENAVWSLLLASGYLKVLSVEHFTADRIEAPKYTLALTDLEVLLIFKKMVKEWFGIEAQGSVYNEFVRALLLDDVDHMNEFMNEIALQSFSEFDIARSVSGLDAPERFYHGFVLGLIVGLQDRFVITSNRESGFGRYDVMLTPLDRERDNAYIIEFKVHKPKREKDLAETVANAHLQIQEKHYGADLVAQGIAPERIRMYGFAFQGKECLIG